jgi:ABC-type lipoprotein export system ATPase subunit
MIILKLKDIEKSYKKRNKTISVLKEVNYDFKSNKLYTISGRSGAGKTTLINILGLISKPTNGEVIIENTNTKILNDKSLSKIRSEKIGFVFQSFYLNPLLTAKENIMLALLINKRTNAKEQAKELLKMVGLEDRENHYPKELSGGEQQRVAIARALANNPEIILADEPTGSLDPENEEKIMELLKSISKDGKCVIIVTHSNSVKKYSDIKLNITNKHIEEEKNEK